MINQNPFEVIEEIYEEHYTYLRNERTYYNFTSIAIILFVSACLFNLMKRNR
ncbi:hypothetical protein MWJ95_21190 [Lysinibacillus sp. Bpr_S20]|nr:hypothetical protein [Lysinibacillus sp. Bpr_S20]